MIFSRFSLVTAALLITLLAACGGGNDEDAGTSHAINRQAMNGVIIPGKQRFTQSAAGLASASADFCSQGAIAIDPLRQRWLQAMSNWQAIALLNFEPASEESRLRIQFYPDDRGFVASQVEALLGSEQPISDASLSTAPLQGLPALEYLLFGELAAAAFQAPDTATRRCDLLKAISRHMATRAGAQEAAWREAAPIQIDGGTDTIADITGAVVAQIVDLRDNKLGGPLGIHHGNQPQAQLCESPLSQSSTANLQNALQATEQLLTGSGAAPGLDDALIDAGYGEYLDNILLSFSQSQQALSQVSLPLCEALQDTTARQSLLALYDGALRQLRDLMQLLPARLAVNTGFNANDGD